MKLLPWSEWITSGAPNILIHLSNNFATIVSVSIDLSGIKQGYREKQLTTANMYLNPMFSGDVNADFFKEMLLQYAAIYDLME